jgi:S1-C subfamily serine protease
LWINRDDRGAIVGAVMAGSPADEAGLRVGDVLAAVDGEPAAGLGLDALRRRLAESAAGTRVVFGVLRGDAGVQAAVVLRDLVPSAQRAV